MASTLCQKRFLKTRFLSKRSRFRVVWAIQFCSNFTSMGFKYLSNNVWRVLRGLVCYYRAKFKNGGQVQKMDFLHVYAIDGSLTKHNRCEVFFEKKKREAFPW